MKDLGGPSELVKSLVDLEKKRIGNSVVSPTFFWRAFTAVQKEFEDIPVVVLLRFHWQNGVAKKKRGKVCVEISGCA